MTARASSRALFVAFALLLGSAAAANAQPAGPAADSGRPLSAESQNLIDAEAFALDLSVPESPAFVALGITPDKVTRPTSPRQLGAALLNGVDDQGNLQTGIAIDFVPYLALGPGDRLTLAEYRQNDFLDAISVRRLASRFAISAATSKGTDSDDKSVRLAVGFRLTPWDEGDARLNTSIDRCVTKQHDVLHARLRGVGPLERTELRKTLGFAADGTDDGLMWNRLADEIKAHGAEWVRNTYLVPAVRTVVKPDGTQAREVVKNADGSIVLEPLTLPFTAQELDGWEKATAKCFEDAKVENWNAAAWDMGIAPTWVSESSGFSDLGSAGGTTWTSLSLNLPGNDWWGFADLPRGELDPNLGETDVYRFMRQHFQVLMHARYRWDTRVDNPTNMPPDSKIVQDDVLLGGRLRAGVPWLAVSAEAAWVRENPVGMPAAEGQRYALSGELRITDSVWLQVSAGSSDGIDSNGDEGFVLGGIRYGLSTESPYDTWRAGVH